MKVWFGFGSEHSMNLVMVGHFERPEDAESAMDAITKIADQYNADVDADHIDEDGEAEWFTPGMLDLLRQVQINHLGPGELQQFNYDIRYDVSGSDLVAVTDEIDVGALMKLMVDRGARVEVYSAHVYKDTGLGR